MSDKEFKTIDEQLNILKSRGLTIDDEEKASDFLLHNNYYRVSGYSLTLRNHDVFSKTASFQIIFRELLEIFFKTKLNFSFEPKIVISIMLSIYEYLSMPAS